MDTKKLLNELSLGNFPAGLGGCRSQKNNFECCEYNITVFDETEQADYVTEYDDELVRIHHGSIKETKPEVLLQYKHMKILSDEQWDLHMLLSKIKEKKKQFTNSFVKSSLVDAAICATKTKDGIKKSDPFSSSWIKCAAYFIADAILGFNLRRPSPAHMLEDIRKLKKNRFNENFTAVNECIGIERATPSLLSRMVKSTIGFSDIVETNGHSKIIQKKYEYFVDNSLFSDCYFYLGYINKNNLLKIKNHLHRKQELIHILKVAFDVENDLAKLESQASKIHATANDMLSILKG